MHSDRKSVDGLWKEWKPEEARPVLGDYVASSEARVITENLEVGHFNELLKSKGLTPSTPTGDMMESGWLAREIERTEKIIDAVPGGWEAVQDAQRRAEEENRLEAEAYRREQERRKSLKSA